MNNSNSEVNKIKAMIDNFDDKTINLYGIYMNNLQKLHEDVWNGVRFFIIVNSLITGAIATVLGMINENIERVCLISLTLSVFGLILTIIGLQILSGHREYYLQSLMSKTILERALNLNTKNDIYAKNLILPWKITDNTEIQKLLQKPDEWLKDIKWARKTITFKLRVAYIIFIIIYSLIIFACLIYLIIQNKEFINLNLSEPNLYALKGLAIKIFFDFLCLLKQLIKIFIFNI